MIVSRGDEPELWEVAGLFFVWLMARWYRRWGAIVVMGSVALNQTAELLKNLDVIS